MASTPASYSMAVATGGGFGPVIVVSNKRGPGVRRRPGIGADESRRDPENDVRRREIGPFGGPNHGTFNSSSVMVSLFQESVALFS